MEPDLDGPPELMLRAYRLLSRVHAEPDLQGTFQAVVDAVVNAAGFELAALNVLLPTGDFEVVAVAGSTEAGRELLGVVLSPATFESEFAAAEHWGRLRFIPHQRAADPYHGSWVPDRAPLPLENSWHPEDALLAPLHDPGGLLIGVLSVDLPCDGLRPSAAQLGLLELLATEVATAIHKGMLSHRVRADEETFRRAFDAAGAGIGLCTFVSGVPGFFTRVNPALSSILGVPEHILRACTEDDLTHVDDRAADQAGLQALLAGETETFRRDKRLRRVDRSWLWVTVTTTVTRDETGAAVSSVSQFEDISVRRTEWERLQFHATHDALTGLPLRPAIMGRLVASVASAHRTSRTGVVMFVDLNDFKLVNDRFGHAVGDQVLQLIVTGLRSALRHGDLVGRLGGDEFVVVADNLTVGQAWDLAERVGQEIASPLRIGGHLIRMSASIGLCPIGIDGQDHPADLLRHADLAMYQQKRSLRPASASFGRQGSSERGLQVGWASREQE